MRESEMRHWALRLHVLAEADREWILSGIDEATGAELRVLLDEISRLGLQVDGSAIRRIAHRLANDAADGRQDIYSKFSSTTPPEAIMLVLDGEPNVVKRIVVGGSPLVRFVGVAEGGSIPSSASASRDDMFPVVSDRVRVVLINATAKRVDGLPNCSVAQRSDGTHSKAESKPDIVRRTARRLRGLTPWRR